jgi:hypothetical protein
MSAVVDHETTWTQIARFKSGYELRFGDDVVATMTFPKMLSSAASVQTEDGNWTIERTGFFGAKTIVRPTDSTTPIGSYTAKAWKRGGIIELSGDRKLLLRLDIWSRTMEICRQDGEMIVSLTARGFFNHRVEVRMNRSALQWPELPWLVPLAYYQIIMMRRDSAAHSAAH